MFIAAPPPQSWIPLVAKFGITCDDITLRIERVARRHISEQIVGCSTIVSRMMDRLRTIAASDAPVLILGETGTGKELVARTLHERSPRHGKAFVAVNCASLPDTLPEAGGGTLLLDHVGDMSTAAQVKLLRVLEEHAIEPLGVRVMSATHRDLAKMTQTGLFRQDLYCRLNVLSIDVPPLRARQGDLALLVQYFLNKFHRPGGGPARMSSAAWSALSAFGFPGNVRQLGRAIEHATVLAGGGEIELRHLPAEIRADALEPEYVTRARAQGSER